MVPVAQQPSQNVFETAGHSYRERVALPGIFEALDLKAECFAEILEDMIHLGIFNGDGNAISRIIAINLDGLGVKRGRHKKTPQHTHGPTNCSHDG